MRLHLLAAAAALLAVPSLAAAQLSNRAISVESGLSAPLRARGTPSATFANSSTGSMLAALGPTPRYAPPVQYRRLWRLSSPGRA